MPGSSIGKVLANYPSDPSGVRLGMKWQSKVTQMSKRATNPRRWASAQLCPAALRTGSC